MRVTAVKNKFRTAKRKKPQPRTGIVPTESEEFSALPAKPAAHTTLNEGKYL